eukprot:TRINITY_DN1816_c0_g1_i1.p1 TRINITY_DN1816_c0_g1~~TRINITY_DN1816_c0_g1_i1.p1  ORF type:complete len:444 (-),score=168.59 TRINITY_DN1816_c0_g1_i1:53-1363(-)
MMHLSGSKHECRAILIIAKFVGVEIEYKAKNAGVELQVEEGKVTGVLPVINYIGSMNRLTSIMGRNEVENAQVNAWVSFPTNYIRPIILKHKGALASLSKMGVLTSSLQTKKVEEMKNILKVIDGHLLLKTFIVGERLSAADIVVASKLLKVCSLLPLIKVIDEFENVKRWMELVLHQSYCSEAFSKIVLCGSTDVCPSVVAREAARARAANSELKIERAERPRKEPKAKKVPEVPKPKVVKAEEPKAKSSSGLPFPSSEPMAEAEGIKASLARYEELGLNVESIDDHEATPNMEAVLKVFAGRPDGKVKNLLLKAKKKMPGDAEDSMIWMISAIHDSNTNLKAVADKLGYGKIVMRFANAALLKKSLNVVQGAVSPIALLNDSNVTVRMAIDSRIMKEDKIIVPAFTTTNSVSMSPADLKKYIESTGRELTVLDF